MQIKQAVAIASVVIGGFSSSGWAMSANAYRELGLSYREQGRYPEAIAVLQKSVELDPVNQSGRVLLGWTQHRAGQTLAAKDTLLRALYRNPLDVPTLNALGIVYLVSGELKPAQTVHTLAALLQPENEVAYYNLSLAFQRLQQYAPAIATAQAAAKLEPANPHPLVAEAIARWTNGDRATAQAVFRQAIGLNPQYTDPAALTIDLAEAAFSPEQIQIAKQLIDSR